MEIFIQRSELKPFRESVESLQDATVVVVLLRDFLRMSYLEKKLCVCERDGRGGSNWREREIRLYPVTSGRERESN